MAYIEIKTSQNVVIEYELASLRDRILAFLLDFLIIICFYLVFGNVMPDFVVYFLVLPVVFFYSFIFEAFNNGKTPGKTVLKIKVAKTTGKEASINDYLTRWVFRIVDIYGTLGGMASILISSSARNQRLGDLLANTTVIRYKPDYSLKLASLLNRSSIDNYQPQFPDVRKYKEEDMLVLKSVIDRYMKYPNAAHAALVNELVEKILQQLNIKEKPVNKIDFLKTILKDYIVLTR
ncbi:MAG: RDD family protein [Cytophagaceae bacterium]